MNPLTIANCSPVKRIFIEIPVLEAWLNSLADIAMTLRLRSQAAIIRMDPDLVHLEDSGALTVLTNVHGEPVRMVVPDRMWRFTKAEDSNGKGE